ncbi:MAG: nucleotidyltransferase family protein [Gemmatimonadetes bacterium]|nr:nucleotidyltransferase family protein [Gemmatimonadota bacterium]
MTTAGPATQAVILARGLGTRMRRASGDMSAQGLDAAQDAAASIGAKGMMPFARPFLDYSLSVLADAGIREAVLVIGPEHQEMRRYFEETAAGRRVTLRFAVQAEPRGTADAVLAAQDAVRDAPFLVLNSDNLYPAEACRAAAAIGGCGLVAFEAEALVALGGIEAERVLKFALIDADAAGLMRTIREKPSADDPLALRAERWVSMNLWSFTPVIFDACARVRPSPRGELELQDAVMTAIRELREPFRVVQTRAGVLDLSCRADVEFVGSQLAAMDPRP